VQNHPGGVVEGHAGLHDLGLAAHDAEVAVAGAQDVCHLEKISAQLSVTALHVGKQTEKGHT